jgi:hypothetical protein
LAIEMTTDYTDGTDIRNTILPHPRDPYCYSARSSRLAKIFFGAAISHRDARRFGSRSLPTKHTKGTKTLSRRFCFIGVLRVFRGQHFFMKSVISA